MPFAWRCCARRSSGPRPGCATGTLRRGRAGWPVSLPSAAPVPPPAVAREGVYHARIPDAGAPAECAVPRVGCIALRPLYAFRDLRRAVVVDEALPAVRQQRRRDDV